MNQLVIDIMISNRMEWNAFSPRLEQIKILFTKHWNDIRCFFGIIFRFSFVFV